MRLVMRWNSVVLGEGLLGTMMLRVPGGNCRVKGCKL